MSEVEPSQDDATELEKILRSGKPWIEQNGTLLIYGLAAILAVAAVFVYLGRQPSGDIQASRDILLAVTPEEFRDVADAYPDKPIGIYARLRQADRLLDDCMTAMFSNREEGINLLEQAETAYQRLADRTDIEDQVRERVLIGLAKVKEIGSDGSEEKTTAAIDAWKRVLSQYENSIMKDYAEDRIAKLATDESKAWYKEFSEQNPKPIDPGLSEGQPAVPALPEGMGSTEEAEADSSEPADTDEAKPETKAKEADAAGEKPKSDAPAETPAPADNKDEEKAEPVKETVKPTKEAKKAAEDTKESAKPAVEKVKEATKPAVDKVKEATKPAADAAKETVEEAAKPAVETAKEAVQKAGEAATEVKEAAKEAVEAAGNEK